jgi:uncharacterized repeat protein (TIGR02543 family)
MFSCLTDKKVTITFDLGYDEPYIISNVEKNSTIFEPKEPSREGYTFLGWYTSNLYTEQFNFNAEITKNVTAYAKWEINQDLSSAYTITFIVDNFAYQVSPYVKYGTIPVFYGDTPSKISSELYDYSFEGWYPAIVSVTGDATYTAIFTQKARSYSVSFLGYNDEVLQESKYLFGSMPSYSDITPVTVENGIYCYTFANWDKEIKEVTSDVTYTAVYEMSLRQYTISFLNYDLSVLSSSTYLYNELPSYNGITPHRESTPREDFTFVGWDNPVLPATKDATYVVVFTKSTRKYEVIFQEYDGLILSTQEVEYGKDARIPMNPDNLGLYYHFVSWSGTPTYITADTILYAEYASIFSYDIANNEANIYDYYDKGYNTLVIPNLKQGEDILQINILASTFKAGLPLKVLDASNANIKSIELGAFSNLTRLETLYLPFLGSSVNTNNTTYFGYCFGNTSPNTQDTNVPSTLKTVYLKGGEVSEYAFSGESTLKSIYIDSPVTVIEQNAFLNCTSLSTLELPLTLLSIETYAFENCASLKDLVIPNNVNSLGFSILEGCNNIESLTIPFIGDDLFSPTVSNLGYLFGSSAYNLNSVVVPISLISVTVTNEPMIPSYQFYNVPTLFNIVFTTNIDSIGEYAFFSCTNITSFDFVSTARYISRYAFSNNTSLQSLTLSDSLEYIGAGAFGYCNLIKNVVVPNSVTYMGRGIFEEWTSIEEISIPYVGKIPNDSEDAYFDHIFGSPEHNNHLYLSDTLKTVHVTSGAAIFTDAFFALQSIVTITLSDDITYIGDYAFLYVTGLSEINLPASLTYLGHGAFAGCSSLKKVVLPNGVTTLQGQVFGSCDSLVTVILTPFLTYIHDYAFARSYALEYLVIEDTVLNIGDWAFLYCDNVKIYTNASSPLEGWGEALNNNTTYFNGEWTYVDGIPTPL